MPATVSWLEAVWVAQSVLFLCGALWVAGERRLDYRAAIAPDAEAHPEERFERILLARGRLATIIVYCIMFAVFTLIGILAGVAPEPMHHENRVAGEAAALGFMVVNFAAGLDIVRMVRDRLTMRELWRQRMDARRRGRAVRGGAGDGA